MHNRSRSRNLISRFMPTLGGAAIAAFCCSAPAMAESSQAEPPAVPILKGDYVLTDIVNCVPGEGNVLQLTGQGSFDPTSGKFKLDGYAASGNPLVLTRSKQSLSYSNSATTITLGDTVYQVTYGKLEKGIATYLSFIAADGTCASQMWLSRQ